MYKPFPVMGGLWYCFTRINLLTAKTMRFFNYSWIIITINHN